MSPIEPFIKLAQQEVGVSKHVPITHFNSPVVVEAQSGALISVIRLQGIPFDTEKTDVINGHSRAWHRALTSLDERFALMGTIHRHKVTCELKGEFTNTFAKQVDDAYQEQFRQQSLYQNTLYLAVIYKGVTTGKVGEVAHLLKKVRGQYVKSARNAQRKIGMKQLNDAVFQLSASLSAFGPHVLGSKDASLGYSELLEYLSLCVNGGQAVHLSSDQAFLPIDKPFQKKSPAHAIYPEGRLSQYLSCKRLFIGDIVQFQGVTKEETCFGALVTVKRYGDSSASIMLDPLLHLDSEFISTNTFVIEAKAESDKLMTRQSNKLNNANDPAISQIDALTTARDMLASDRIAMGYHHNTIMLLADSIQAVEQHVVNTIKCYQQAGLVAVRETLGCEAAFWAQIPGNFKYIARGSLISSQNFVDFFPLHNYQTGFKDGNHLGSAMTLIETPSKTPLWMNLHAKGASVNPSPGHTTLIGGNGSGKTVAMYFFDVELNRYGGRSFFFDRDRGAEIYIRASGGHYSILSPVQGETIQFNPLQLDDTPGNRKFCKDWLIQLVKKEEEKEVDETVVQQLSDCVDYAYEQLDKMHRNLTNVTKLLPVTFSRWIRLRRWLRGDGARGDGEYAYLFDNETDALALNTKMGFDMTHFLDNEPPTILAAVTMYLFHRIELTLQEKGQLVSLFLDEAWQYLDNAYWQAKLKKWLPTLRKRNCHIVFATQSPQSVASSPISHTILDNCATNIYFANPQAKTEHYIDGFNLTASEFACIQENEPQTRLFLYKQGHESALGRLNLGHLKDLLNIMSGTQATVSLLMEICADVGDEPAAWLPIFLKRCSER